MKVEMGEGDVEAADVGGKTGQCAADGRKNGVKGAAVGGACGSDIPGSHAALGMLQQMPTAAYVYGNHSFSQI